MVEVNNSTDKTCNLGNDIACKIYTKALENGLTREQSLIVVSISAHETGYWTSRVFKTKNNFGGVMCNTGLRTYDSLESGLNHFVNLLTNYYFNQGLTTVEQIGNKYCPVGASNDPTGVNKNWIPSVTNIYNNYLQKWCKTSFFFFFLTKVLTKCGKCAIIEDWERRAVDSQAPFLLSSKCQVFLSTKCKINKYKCQLLKVSTKCKVKK